MMRVLVDANVILDALLPEDERPDGERESAIDVLNAASQSRITGIITPVIFAFVVHGAKPRKRLHQGRMESALGHLLDFMVWATITPEHFRTALASSFTDVEDGVQFFAAGRIDAIVTRNVRDFKDHVPVPVLTAKQFVAKHL